YGDGPVGHPFLFQRNDPAKLLTGSGGDDVLRNREGTAIIGDPRNDSHVLMSQMQLAFGQAHHALVAGVPAQCTAESPVERPAAPARRVDWMRFFDANGPRPAQRAKKIDGRLVGALIALPVSLTGECEVDAFHSRAVRDLERGQGVGLPSGEAVAAYLGEKALTPGEVGGAAEGSPGHTPLWYYILREADVRGGGSRLGPVGARIVGEVLIGLLDLDPTSVRHAPGGRRPHGSLFELLTGSAFA